MTHYNKIVKTRIQRILKAGDKELITFQGTCV